MYRTEHPKPQFERKTWQNLNGKWQFEIDNGKSGVDRGLYKTDTALSGSIEVPFCPESELSGVNHKDFMYSVWYKRKINIEKEQLNGIVKLHFGAVDYKAIVYVNGQEVGVHKGGYVSFSFDITKFLQVGENEITLNADDDTRNRLIPSGKQSYYYNSYSCFYTRTTGIWQTAWLEFMPKNHVEKAKYYTDIEAGSLTAMISTCGSGKLFISAYYQGKPMGSASTYSHGGLNTLTILLKEKHLWEVGDGKLYNLEIEFEQDKVKSYFGLRSLRLDGYKFLINEKSVFQRLVLDQGFYPKGVYTAPSDADLEKDIDISMAMGFNGARLHEKVFEERFLYHCDKKGYIVWGEYPNWGVDLSYSEAVYAILPEWIEAVERDFNHPSIIGWCPFNETWDTDRRKQCDEILKTIYYATKAIDQTRPVIDTSGCYHVITDIFDVHDYEQDVEKFRKNNDQLKNEGTLCDLIGNGRQKYTVGQPTFVSEYGGILWSNDESSWGYGNAPKTEQEFFDRLKGLTDILMDNPKMFGLCYTQLIDVEQEQNGFYTFDRKAKFLPEKVFTIFKRKAAIEE